MAPELVAKTPIEFAFIIAFIWWIIIQPVFWVMGSGKSDYEQQIRMTSLHKGPRQPCINICIFDLFQAMKSVTACLEGILVTQFPEQKDDRKRLRLMGDGGRRRSIF